MSADEDGTKRLARLSRRQREIAELVAAGNSNRAIAERLHLSERTVEVHVAAAFAKLEVESRVELTALLVRLQSRAEAWAAPTTNLPAIANSFVGRESEIAHIAERIGEARLVTVLGAGGVGKTRVSIETARALADRFPDGVWFVDFATAVDVAGFETALASALDVRSAGVLRSAILAALKRKMALLIFDNCEHLLADVAPLVQAVLEGAGRVRILATARERLGVRGEVAYALPPLDVPPVGVLAADPRSFSAVRLFAERAKLVDAAFDLAESATTVGAIVRSLDGIPLAIELAAARVKLLHPKELLARLDDRLRVLTAGNRGALPRHQTIRALIGWSYDLLESHERRTLRELSIFAGPFTLDAAAAVCDAGDPANTLDALEVLHDKSLLAIEPATEGRRYRLLESTRAFAREALDATGERILRERHAEYFFELATRLGGNRTRPRRERMSALREELPNLPAALAWSLDSGDRVALGQRLANELAALLTTIDGREAIAVLSHAYQRGGDDRALLGQLLRRRAGAQLSTMAIEGALDDATRALEYLPETEIEERCEALGVSGLALVHLRRLDEAEACAEKLFATARAAGVRRMIGRALATIAFAAQSREDYDRAAEYLMRAREQFDDPEYLAEFSNLINSQAETEHFRGDYAAALRYNAEYLAVARRADLPPVHRIVGLNNRALYAIHLGRAPEAYRSACEALTLARRHGYPVQIAFAARALAAVALHVECYDTAANLFGYCDAAFARLIGVTETEDQRDEILKPLATVMREDEIAARLVEGRLLDEEQIVDLVRELIPTGEGVVIAH